MLHRTKVQPSVTRTPFAIKKPIIKQKKKKDPTRVIRYPGEKQK